MAVGDELRKSYASDGTTYNQGIQTRQISAADAESLSSVIVEKKKARPSATRSSVNAADSTANVSGDHTSALDVGNSMHIAVWIEGTPASGTATIYLLLFDEAATPLIVGKTEDYTFTLDATFTNGATDFFSEVHVFDIAGACKVYPKVRAITGTSMNFEIYMKAL